LVEIDSLKNKIEVLETEKEYLEGDFKETGKKYFTICVVQRFIQQENNKIDEELSYDIAFYDVLFAKQYDIEIHELLAIQRVESMFDPLALSPVGAKGLNQLHGITGVWLLSELGYDHTEENLYDLKINIEAACYYRRYLLNSFDNDKTYSSIVYNGGYKELNKYINKKKMVLATRQYLKDIAYYETKADEFITSISNLGSFDNE